MRSDAMEPLVAKIIYIAGYWVAITVIRARHIQVRRQVRVRANRNTRLDISLLFILGAAGFLLTLIYTFTPLLTFADYFIPVWIGVLGVGILAAGDWLFWKSHNNLGANWSPKLEIREGHTLITAGIYARVRHPMYASIWLLVIGQAMILPNYVAGLSGLVTFGILYFQRVGKEERMMMQEFGSEYEQYVTRTGRLLPKLRPRMKLPQ